MQDKRQYAKPEGIRKLYHTQHWKDTRAYVISQYDGLDLFALYRHGEFIPADTVHHIEPTSEQPGRFYDTDNMIPVSRASHDEIHALYRQPGAEKIKDELREALLRYKKRDFFGENADQGGGR